MLGILQSDSDFPLVILYPTLLLKLEHEWQRIAPII